MPARKTVVSKLQMEWVQFIQFANDISRSDDPLGIRVFHSRCNNSRTGCRDLTGHLFRADCPTRFVSELKAVFPKANPSETRIIPTCQQSKLDLTNWGDDVEKEKDALLEKAREKIQQRCDIS